MPIVAPRPYVLIVEDDRAIAELLETHLKHDGFDCAVAADGASALAAVFERQPDAVLLDWMLPPPDGLTLLKRWRSERETHALPILMLTALDSETHIVQALESGADDYVCKPFSLKELMARLRTLLRRQNRWLTLLQKSGSGAFTYKTSPSGMAQGSQRGFISLEAADHALHRAKVLDENGTAQGLKLDPTSYRLLQTLYERPQQTLDRGTLHSAVWGRYSDADMRTVDVYIKRLREALGSINPQAAAQIETVRGVGYRFALEI